MLGPTYEREKGSHSGSRALVKLTSDSLKLGAKLGPLSEQLLHSIQHWCFWTGHERNRCHPVALLQALSIVTFRRTIHRAYHDCFSPQKSFLRFLLPFWVCDAFRPPLIDEVFF